MGCENCQYLKCSRMVVRGVMDCDPPEYYCELGMDLEEDCEKFVNFDYYVYMNGYDDYLIAQGESRRQEG